MQQCLIIVFLKVQTDSKRINQSFHTTGWKEYIGLKMRLKTPDSIRKVGWDSNKRKYDVTRRVALVKDNYLVVILIYAEKKARFITAYEIDNAENLDKILRSPDWT